MLKIPTYHGPNGSHVTVEDTDEAEVYLSIEVDPTELAGRRSTPRAEVLAEIDDLLVRFPEDGAATSGTYEGDLLTLADEVRRLRAELGSIGPEVTRCLTNDEAREVAAALWHHADENERRR